MYKVYCDFDATVTVHDIWDVFFRQFGKPEAFTIWQKFNSGEFTAAECIRFACSTVANADKDTAESLFRAQPLRDGFHDFYNYCLDNSLDLKIVSDGFSVYIRPIHDQHQLPLQYFANTIEITDAGTLSVEMPNQRESCRNCGACKCSAIINTSSETDTIVYIGDGYSDHCPVEMADIIFARDMLARFCTRSSIPFTYFDDFHTVKSHLDNLRIERPKYKRSSAQKQRQKLITIE